MKIKYFKSAADFRAWLAAHHAGEPELFAGFYKKGTGRGGLAYSDAVDEALCFGWIDGLKKRADEFSYMHRFTPRRAGSNWSRANLERVARLRQAGRMTPAGEKIFAARDPRKCGVYLFESAARTLSPADERRFKADKRAWDFFQRQPPGYRRTAIKWVVSAKREDTRARRLARLMADSGQERRLGLLA